MPVQHLHPVVAANAKLDRIAARSDISLRGEKIHPAANALTDRPLSQGLFLNIGL
jgi:hypothetical protein